MKKDLTNPLVIISFFLILSTIFLFGYFYFVKPFINKPKQAVEISEKEDLKLLTTAFLDQNIDLDISGPLFSVNQNEFQVASEYYYLMNGKEKLDNYEDILEIAKLIFNNSKIKFNNFVINLDDCGKEKYSSIEGFIYNDSCDLKGNIYEISDIYKIEDLYIVEFYSSLAEQKIKKNQNACETGNPFSYDLRLIDLEKNEIFNNSYSKCLENFNYGVFYLKNEILNEIKSDNYKYKMAFKKNDLHFTFYSLKK